MFEYKTSGTCSRKISLEIGRDNIIKSVSFEGGCRGNTQGVAKLCINKNAHEVCSLLKGIKCQGNTSCPDQLSIALEKALEEEKNAK